MIDPLRPRRWGILLALLGVAVVVAATAVPGQGPATPAWCLSCALRDRELSLDVAQNVLLYLPLGAGLRLAGVRSLGTLLGAAALSLAIETLQGTILGGRFASAIDLAANVVGAGFGGCIAGSWRAFVLPSRGVARWLAVGAALAWLAVLAVSAVALRPSRPQGTYIARLRAGSPAAAGDGRVRTIAASLGDRALADQERLAASALHISEGAGGVQLQASFAPSSPMAERQPALRIVAADGRQLLLLGQQGADGVLRLRLRATDLRFGTPVLRLRQFMARRDPPLGAPDRVALTAVIRSDGLELVGRAAGRRADDRLRLTPWLGWTLIAPMPTSAEARVVLGALWIAVFLVPIGYWSAYATAPARARRRDMLLSGCAIALLGGVIGTVALPAALGSPPAGVADWISSLAALAAGCLLGGRVSRRASAIGAPES